MSSPVAANTASGESRTKYLVRVCAITDIPLGEGREVMVGDVRIALFRSRTGAVFATQATCPHRQGPLADGIMSDSKVTCPMHDLLFDLVSGEAIDGLCDGIKTFDVELDPGGGVLLSMAEINQAQLTP